MKIEEIGKSPRRNYILYVVLGILFAVATAVITYHGSLSTSKNEKCKQIQADFLRKEKAFDDLFDKLTFDPRIKTTIDLAVFCEENCVDNQGFIFYIYKDSLLSAWSSNEIMPPDYLAKADTVSLQYVDNKWVYVKRAYYFANKYMGYIVMNEETEGVEYVPLSVSTGNTAPSYTIKDNAGQDAFRIVINKELKMNEGRAFFELCLWLLTLSLFYFALVLFLVRKPFFQSNTNRLFWVIIPMLFLPIKIFFTHIHFPEDLFSSMYHAYSGYGSLGEFFIYSYALFFLSTLFMQYFTVKQFLLLKKWIKILISVVFTMIVLSFNLFAYHIVTLVTSDSFMVLSPQMVFQFNTLSAVVILSIAFILWAVFIFMYKSLLEIFHLVKEKKLFFFILLGGFLCITLFVGLHAFFAQKSNVLIPHSLFLLFVAVVVFSIVKPIKWSNIIFQCLVYLILSCIILYATKWMVEEREEKYKESISNVMLSVQDPFVFYTFSELAQDMLSDTNIVNFFDVKPYNPIDIERYIISTYLNKYTKDYRISIETGLYSSTQDSLLFNRLMYDNFATDRISSDDMVSFRSIGFGKSEYMLRLPFPQGEHDEAGWIFIVFRQYILSEEQSYMEESGQNEMINYSYAGYENNSLKINANNLGISYLYRLTDYELDTIYSGMVFTYDGAEHTVFTHDTMTLLVSAQKGVMLGKLSFIIILFFVLFTFSLIPTSLSLLWRSQKRWRPGFQSSMQFYMTILVAITIITTGVLFFRFFANLRTFDRLESHNQTANKIKEILTKSIENTPSITNLTPEIIQNSSTELAAFFNIDLLNLNIYNTDGKLIKSYGKGVYISTPMNPAAIKQYSINKYGAATLDEVFGKEKYKSSYRSITNGYGEIVGYINLLTFSERYATILDPQHTQFLVKFMLVCLITILLITFLSLFLIRRLIHPLSRVTERLSTISLRGDEAEIEWSRDDEFGKLVETYNFLIAKLHINAELLKRTSQELAWKDMAKQIAHEIKNPLTPMRLTTQQIMRQLSDENMDKERLENYLKMILAQTDALSEIATSFSNFAQANQQDGSCQDLFAILKNAISSYNEADIDIVLENRTGQDAVFSFVSRSQMMQVFNNLIKNAVQAKKPERKQLISIVLQNHGDKMWQVKIADTGTGMTAEVKEKIFQPNFTTKTSGMGLGLALVKQIITAQGGSITFESSLGEGTTFWIMLPKYIP